jgi:hypothetical protein
MDRAPAGSCGVKKIDEYGRWTRAPEEEPLDRDGVLLAGHAAAEHGAQPATFAKPGTTRSVRFRKVEHFQGILRNMPRPGIEPGLEVPETSVMSFSLPGQTLADLINISGFGAGQARPRQMAMRYADAFARASGGAHCKKAPFDVAEVQTGDDRGRDQDDCGYDRKSRHGWIHHRGPEIS